LVASLALSFVHFRKDRPILVPLQSKEEGLEDELLVSAVHKRPVDEADFNTVIYVCSEAHILPKKITYITYIII